MADMSDEHRLLEAIRAAPDDDAPRMVYADWLQGQGDPRGELIQLQCQLAATPDDDRRRNIRIAENKLLAAHRDAWLAPVRDALPVPHPGVEYKFELVRGFVESASITLACLAHLDKLFAAAPLVRHLRLSPNGHTLTDLRIPQPRLGGALAGAPLLARISSLELSLPGGGNAVVRELASAAQLRGLRELTIRASVWGDQTSYFNAPVAELQLDDHGAALLAASPHLAGVERLFLEANRLTAKGVAALANGAWQLRELDLAHNAIEPEGIAAALAGPATRELEVLRLAGIVVSADDAARLVAGKTLPKLRDLDLEKSQIGADGVAALCDALRVPLERLRVERNNLCDAGAHVLAGCSRLTTLRSLEMGHNRIGHKGGAALASSPYLANLERLTLNEPRWKPETVALFAESTTLASTKVYAEGKLVARGKVKPTAAQPEPTPKPPSKPRSKSKSGQKA